MAKEIKKFDNFLNENYYESSPTMVPGQGVGAGLFHTVGSANVKQDLYEKGQEQDGPRGESPDPDYTLPAEATHATWMGQIALGDVVEDVNPECKYHGSFGKAIGIIGSGEKAQIQYLIANEGEGWGVGEVAKISAPSLKLVRKNAINA
jgi:hypothetical protein